MRLIISFIFIYLSVSGIIPVASEPASKSDIQQLIHHMDKRFEAIDKRFEDMNKRFEDMNKRIDMLFWILGMLTTIFMGVLIFLNSKINNQEEHFISKVEHTKEMEVLHLVELIKTANPEIRKILKESIKTL